jgi:hypothetical protein
LARQPDVRKVQFWVRLSPRLADQVEAERTLYAAPISKAEVVSQLLGEAVAFRRMHRSPPKPRREPFIFSSGPKP